MLNLRILLSLVVWIVSINAEQVIVEGPQETYVHIGKTVILKCKVENQKGSVQWMKNGFGLGVDRGLKFFPRYSMVGSVSKGEYNLQIVNTTVGDDDVYACQISEAANEAAQISSPAKLTVLMRPTPPHLHKSGHILTAIAGEPVSQSCVSRKGKPPARLGWAISSDTDGKHILTWLGDARAKFGHLFKSSGVAQASMHAEVLEELHKEGQVYSVSSNITFIPRPEDDRRYLVCLSQHETFPEKAEADTLKLSLQYAPRVNLTIASPHRLREGGSALLACNVDAKPLDNIRISWYRNGNEIPGKHTDTLAFESLKMEDHNAEYSCQAANVIGANKANLKLDVTFAPRIMSTVQDKEVNEGETTAFRCDAVGNPTPQIFWTKSGSDQIIAKGEILSVENVRNWQQGEYICTAIVDGFKHVYMSHFLHIRGAPVLSVDNELTTALGDTVEISCRISGRPKPPEVKWTKNGDELNYASGRMQVHQIPRHFGVESRLTIRETQESDMGTYNCTANNGLGSQTKGIDLRKKNVIDFLASLDIQTLLALLGLVLSFIIAISCCLYCRSRRFGKKKSSNFLVSDDQSDVTVKCEALDGQYFPEMYSSPLDNGNMMSPKDYISIPQNNPDLDFIGTPSTFSGNMYPKYLNSSICEYNGMAARYDHSYGSFASGVSTPGISESYGLPDKGTVLETLQEVETPRASTYNFLGTPDHVRPISRSSTHV